MTKERDHALDVTKLIMAILVICIHTDPLESYSDTGNFILIRVIARIAVPFFFITAGYYFFVKSRSKVQFMHYMKKLGTTYLLWSVIYLPVNIYVWMNEGFTKEWLQQYIQQVFFVGTYYHLWFLPALMFAIAIVYYAQKRMSLRQIAAVSLVLYLIGLLADSYYRLTAQVPVLHEMVDGYLAVFEYSRNGLFFGLPFVALGALMAKELPEWKLSDAICEFGLLFSFGWMVFEAALLRILGWPIHDSMYVMLVPTVVFGFIVLLRLRVPGKPIHAYASDISMVLYLIHPAMILGVRVLSSQLPILKANSLIYFTVIFLLSFTVSHFWVRRKTYAAKAGLGRNQSRPHHT
ncbi:acyltransferase family protein [Paenibacillus guangzhouensis]|uniref:acyltransferase family protein n=1 Tax=Paenibacillus guangzhouensis TaxID=1473112 RepID=UPI001267829F|nr:acyltransferase [Paenibacillus guangzhouensis]